MLLSHQRQASVNWSPLDAIAAAAMLPIPPCIRISSRGVWSVVLLLTRWVQQALIYYPLFRSLLHELGMRDDTLLDEQFCRRPLGES